MTKREIANLCCRVLAVYALIQATLYLGSVASYLVQFAESELYPTAASTALRALPVLAGPIVLLIFAIVLWRKSGIIAAWMVGHDLQDDQHEPEAAARRATSREVHMIAFSVLGLWILADAVPGLAASVTYMLTTHVDASDDYDTGIFEWIGSSLMQNLLRLIIGTYLLFGAPKLVTLLRRARDFGLEESERPGYAGHDQSPPRP